MYWKLAIQNIRRNLRDYIIYFVTLNSETYRIGLMCSNDLSI